MTRSVNGDPEVRELILDFDSIPDSASLRRKVAELKERNFASKYFISGEAADREAEECRRRLLQSAPIVIDPRSDDSSTNPPPDAFR